MRLILKKSQITDWWIAVPENLLYFSNIVTQKALNKELVVVGLDRTSREFCRSDHLVVKVENDGVTTESGSFYPLKEAHELYLQFLIDVNKDNTLIATNWNEIMRLSSSNRRIIYADIIENRKVIVGGKFDFTPNEATTALLTGYSNLLNSNIVLTTFSKRDASIRIGIPQSILNTIYCVSDVTLRQRKEMIKEVHKLISESKF